MTQEQSKPYLRKTRSGKYVTNTDDKKSGPSLEQVARSFGIKADKPNKNKIRNQVIQDRIKAKQKPS